MNPGNREDLVDNAGIVLGEATRADPTERVEGRGGILLTADDVRRTADRGGQGEFLTEAVGRGHQGIQQDTQAHFLHRAGLPAAPA